MENPQLLNAMLWLIVVCIGVVLVWSVVGLTADLYDLMYGPRMGALKKEIAELKKHIINYAKTRDTYMAYRKASLREKARFRSAHEAELLLHEAAKRAFDEFGEKKLPTVKTLQAEYSDLLAKKKAAYEDYRRLRKENQELQTVKANVDALLRIEQVQEYQQEKENNQEQGR